MDIWGWKAWRPALAAAIAAAVLIVAVGCGGDDSDDPGTGGGDASADIEDKTIGYVTILNDPVQQRFFRVFEGAADAVGWNTKFADAGGDTGEAVRIVDNYLRQGVDGIVAACVETPIIRKALDDAADDGVPTIAVACPVSPPEDAWSAVYAEDEAGLATALAEHVAEELQASDEEGSVGILYDETFLSGKIRRDIFVETLNEVGVEIAAEQTVGLDDPTGNARRAAQGMLSANPDMNAMIAIYDWMAPPAISAIETAGKEDDVSVYSFYADHVNLPLLLEPDGPMQAVVDGPVENVSALAVDQLLENFSGGEIDPNAADELEYEFTVYTKDTAGELDFDPDTYLGPVDLQSVLDPWLEQWREEYALPSAGRPGSGIEQ